MKEFIEKLIEKIKSKSVPLGFGLIPDEKVIRETDAISIVNQLAEEYMICYKSCTECEAYDKKKHYCPKWCDVIKNTAKELAEEYNNDFCEWGYDEFEEKWQTDCGVLFALHDSDREITHFCPCCGKEIKIAPYQPKGE